VPTLYSGPCASREHVMNIVRVKMLSDVVAVVVVEVVEVEL
jgi:hypothetical protein